MGTKSTGSLLDLSHSADKLPVALARLRWPGSIACPHCDRCEGVCAITPCGQQSPRRVRSIYWRCRACGKQFSVTCGSILENTKLPLDIWVNAVALLCGAGMGVTFREFGKGLSLSYRSAFRVGSRILEARRKNPLRSVWSAAIKRSEAEGRDKWEREILQLDFVRKLQRQDRLVSSRPLDSRRTPPRCATKFLTLWPTMPTEAMAGLLQTKRNSFEHML